MFVYTDRDCNPRINQLWNQLTNEIKDIKSESLFKSRIKVYLYNKLYTE